MLRVDRCLNQLGQLLATWEVPVGSLHALRQLHDVVAVAVMTGSHHVVQHELEVLGRLGVPDEEEAGLSAHRPERHRLAHDLERLLALPVVACNKTPSTTCSTLRNSALHLPPTMRATCEEMGLRESSMLSERVRPTHFSIVASFSRRIKSNLWIHFCVI